MELTKKQSRQLDLILRELTKNRKSLNVEKMQEELFPEEDYDYCANLFYILRDYYPDCYIPKVAHLKIYSGLMIM